MKTSNAIRGALAFSALLTMSSAAQAAGLFRAYLSSTGSDANACTVPAPCRLLPAAIAAVTDGGEIWMLDSANYNSATVSVTKSVTILAIPGALGSVVAIGGPAISASTPATTVTLRNLVIVPFPGGGGTHGIDISGAGKVTLEGSVVSGHSGSGINVSSPAIVRIVNSTVRDNAVGIYSTSAASGTNTEVSGSKVLGNSSYGLFVESNLAGVTTTAAVSNSIISGNGDGTFFIAYDGVIRGTITRSTIANSPAGSGVQLFTNILTGIAVVTVEDSMVTGTTTGFSKNGAGASLESLGNNLVRQNGTPSFGGIVGVTPQ